MPKAAEREVETGEREVLDSELREREIFGDASVRLRSSWLIPRRRSLTVFCPVCARLPAISVRTTSRRSTAGFQVLRLVTGARWLRTKRPVAAQ